MSDAKNNNISKKTLRFAVFSGFLGMAFPFSFHVNAQELPPLPPLPPLPGMEAPAAAPKAVPAPPPAAPAVTEEIPDFGEMPPVAAAPPSSASAQVAAPAPADPPVDDGFTFPDFGLFDPAELPAEQTATSGAPVAPAITPQMTDGPPLEAASSAPQMAEQDLLTGEDQPSNQMALPIPPLPDLPDFGELTDPASQPSESSQAASANDSDSLKIPTLDGFDMPEFDVPVFKPPVDTAKDEKPTETQKAEKSDKKIQTSDTKKAENTSPLANAAPAWMSQATTPKAKPEPSRSAPTSMASAGEDTTPIAVPDANQERSLADLIDQEMQRGENYEDDFAGVLESESANAPKSNKRVVWPRNFKTQQLPPQIYKKQYSNANRHLPHAMYQKEIEAHLFSAVGANDLDAVRALLRTGVPLTIKNGQGEGLLVHAVKAGADSAVQLLIGLGMKADQTDRYGTTPLHRAVFAGRQDLATILMRAGASPHVPDGKGITPMALAQMRHDQAMMQVLGFYQMSNGPTANPHLANYQPY